MVYIFDSNAFIELFTHFYESRFPTLWDNFNKLVLDGNVISVREVLNEIGSHSNDNRLTDWVKEYKYIFEQPDDNEVHYLQEIFKKKHFQSIIEKKKLLTGKPVADPFIVAKAAAKNAIVITQEKYKKNGVKIPNVCEFLNVECTDVEGFMKSEKWKF